MIKEKWENTFFKLEEFTNQLEKAKSHSAIQEFKPLWRIMKSIQLKFVPDLNEELAVKLERIIKTMDIRDVSASAFSEVEATNLLQNFSNTCSIDPDMFGQPNKT